MDQVLQPGPSAPTAILGLSSLKYHPVDKANAVVDCMTCVTKTMNGEWMLEPKLCLKLQIVTPLKEYDHVTYRNY
jgi:hypothetical protein